MKLSQRAFHFLTLFILLLIATAHTIRLDGLNMNADEVWHIWQTFGTPQQIIAWTPYDWTPLYVLVLGGWKLMVGIHPLMLRVLSLLLSLVGAAFVFRAGKHIGGRSAGLLSMLIYSALAYSAFLSGYIRPYALAHALIPTSFYLILIVFQPRYLSSSIQSNNGILYRSVALKHILLILVLTASFYTTLVAPIWITFFGLYTLIVYPIRSVIVRWIPIVIGTVILSIPILITRGSVAVERFTAEPLPLLDGLKLIWENFGGNVGWIWLLVCVVGLVSWMTRRRAARPLIALAVWGIGGLITMGILQPILGLFQPSYSFWTLTGMALFGGLLLATGSLKILLVTTLISVGLLFVPVPAQVEVNYASPGVANFKWLQNHLRAGDVVVLDPGFNCLQFYELDYYTRAFFPQGLVTTTSISDARRVWYAYNVNTQNQTYASAVTARRVPSIFVGTPTCFFRLYEAPPDLPGIAFANGMRFHGGEMVEHIPDQTLPVMFPVAREGETITLRLWWSADVQLSADYSVGVYLLDADGHLLAQIDSAPQVEPPETSRWEINTYYIEERLLTLPYPLGRSTYRFALALYQPWDQKRISSPRQDAQRLLTLFDLGIMSW